MHHGSFGDEDEDILGQSNHLKRGFGQDFGLEMEHLCFGSPPDVGGHVQDFWFGGSEGGIRFLAAPSHPCIGW